MSEDPDYESPEGGEGEAAEPEAEKEAERAEIFILKCFNLKISVFSPEKRKAAENSQEVVAVLELERKNNGWGISGKISEMIKTGLFFLLQYSRT